MEREEWLRQMQEMTEVLYDHFAPQYWVKFGLYPNETHQEYIKKFLDRMPPHGILLSAACGAGRYDGILLEAGHRVVGIDQSAKMLDRAREHFPEAQYEKMSLQEMNFHEVFDGVICIDALEHVCPEDWPRILCGFQEALKPDGVLYFTAELPDAEEIQASYGRAKSMGLPVVLGEVADEVEASYRRVKAITSPQMPPELADAAVYHFYPAPEQLRTWIEEAGFAMEEEGAGNWYQHLIVRKK